MFEDVYFVNAKGQMEFNFEALELVTSKEFADLVSSAFKSSDDFNTAMKYVQIEKDRSVVIVSGEYIVQVFKYSFGNTYHSFLDMNDLRELSSMFEVMK